jgi:6-phosphofructo-2-kinase/fructose-2,6-biphosphatase 2
MAIPSRELSQDLQRAAGVLMDMQSKGELDPTSRGRPPATFGAGGPM